MAFALLYADNSDVVGTYSSRDEALAELASFVAEHPELQDDVGLRPYQDGRPAGDFRSATDVLSGQITQPPLGDVSATRRT